METHKEINIAADANGAGKKLRVMSSNSPEANPQLTLSKADRIRGVTRSLVVDALAVLEKMREGCESSPDLMENYYLLYHYLDYLKRFSEGRA